MQILVNYLVQSPKYVSYFSLFPNVQLDDYGYTVFSCFGKTPPDNYKSFRPSAHAVKLPITNPSCGI